MATPGTVPTAAELLAPEETLLAREQRFRQQAWYGEKSDSVTFLKTLHFKFPWGFVIYRTIYTPESDTMWATVLERLHVFIKFSLDFRRLMQEQESGFQIDSIPDDLVYQLFQNDVVEDRESLDGASIKVVRKHFRTWREQQDSKILSWTMRRKFCLMIDEDALKSLFEAQAPTIENYNQPRQRVWVTAIDPFFDRQTYYEFPYAGWMRVPVDSLWYLCLVLEGRDFEEECPPIYFPGQIPVFEAELIDPPEGLEGKVPYGGTTRGGGGFRILLDDSD
jgi:hypothetical protein